MKKRFFGKKRKKEWGTIRGRYIRNSKGYGFVEPFDSEDRRFTGGKGDLFIPSGMEKDAWDRDTVEAKVVSGHGGGRRTEGRIVRVTERFREEVSGVISRRKTFFLLKSSGGVIDDIVIPMRGNEDITDDDVVTVKITDYGDERRLPMGEIVKRWGRYGDPGMKLTEILLCHDIPLETPADVKIEAERVCRPVRDDDFAGRCDLRSYLTVTIDGEDTKDLDDAITVSSEPEGYLLMVHIADVSEYVREGGALDRDAFLKGTSVYLPDRVVPMLPAELSNGICSLNQGEDRLALTAMMMISKNNGKTLSFRIVPSVIRVDKRLSYNGILPLLEGTDEGNDPDITGMIRTAGKLAKILKKRRLSRGSLEFGFPESRIILDEKGMPAGVEARRANEATGLIEEFMLAANENVAALFASLKMPFVYRVHERPDEEKLSAFFAFAGEEGYHARPAAGAVKTKDLCDWLDGIEEGPERDLMGRLLLRSLKQARYSVMPAGHFGLGMKDYCHFTSPIRRYPDLMIHRIIKEYLKGRMTAERILHFRDITEKAALQSSITERRAEEAEREAVKLLKAVYMKDHLNEPAEGTVSSLTGWGMFVELDDTVEGMVPIGSMPDDDYIFLETCLKWKGRHTKRLISIGDRVRVKAVRVDEERNTIEFAMCEDPGVTV